MHPPPTGVVLTFIFDCWGWSPTSPPPHVVGTCGFCIDLLLIRRWWRDCSIAFTSLCVLCCTGVFGSEWCGPEKAGLFLTTAKLPTFMNSSFFWQCHLWYPMLTRLVVEKHVICQKLGNFVEKKCGTYMSVHLDILCLICVNFYHIGS